MKENKKLRNYWNNKKNCIEAINSVDSISRLIKKHYGAYDAIKRNGWHELLSVLNSPIAKMGTYNNFNNCLTAAKRHVTRTSFMRNEPGAYAGAIRNGWYDIVTSHMDIKTKPRGYWNILDNVMSAASNCTSITEFNKRFKGAYKSALKHNWIPFIYQVMELDPSKYGKWQIKENCINEAKKYKTIIDLMNNSSGAYHAIHQNGWQKEAFAHMPVKNNTSKYMVYIIYFEYPLRVYTGLSRKIEKRYADHLEKSSNPEVKEFMEKGFSHNFTIILNELNEKEATEAEENINDIFKYQDKQLLGDDIRNKLTNYNYQLILDLVDRGYISSNIKQTGAIGGTTKKWTKKKVTDFALSVHSRSEFYENSAAYKAAKNGNYLKEILELIPALKLMDLTEQKCQEIALNYSVLPDFRKYEPSVYSKAHKNKWLTKITTHIYRKKKPNGYWSYENFQLQAKKCRNINDFIAKYPGGYDAVIRNGWIEDLRALYFTRRAHHGKYKCMNKCQSEAKKYTTITEFEKGAPGAYRAAKINEYLKEFTQHMKRPYKGN